MPWKISEESPPEFWCVFFSLYVNKPSCAVGHQPPHVIWKDCLWGCCYNYSAQIPLNNVYLPKLFFLGTLCPLVDTWQFINESIWRHHVFFSSICMTVSLSSNVTLSRGAYQKKLAIIKGSECALYPDLNVGTHWIWSCFGTSVPGSVFLTIYSLAMCMNLQNCVLQIFDIRYSSWQVIPILIGLTTQMYTYRTLQL